MYSTIVDGEVIDWKYKKLQKGHYAFYLGDTLVGQVVNSSRGVVGLPYLISN